MTIKSEAIPQTQKDDGFSGNAKTVVELTSAEIAATEYIEVRVDGVSKGTVRISKN